MKEKTKINKDDLNNKFELFFNKSPIAQLVVDKKGIVVGANNISCILFKTDEKNIINKSIDRFIKEERKLTILKQLKDCKDLDNTIFYTKDNVAIKIKSIEINNKNNIFYNITIQNCSSELLKKAKEKQVQNKLEFLYSTAQGFLSFNYNDNIFEYIGKAVREMIPRSIVIVSYFDDNEGVYIIKNIAGIGKKINTLSKTLGVDIIGHRVKVSSNFRTEETLGKLIKMDDNTIDYNLTSNSLYYLARELFMINNHYSVAINNKKELLGNIGIFTRSDNDIVNKELIEMFAVQAGTAIQKYNLQNELILAKEKAEGSDKLKSAFLSNMSHEIRTPMNTIIGFSEMLSKNDISNEQREKYYNFVTSSSNTLMNLIDDIIDISKIESGQLAIINSNFNPYLLLHEILLVFRKSIKAKKSNIKLILNVEDELQDINMNTDNFRLKQIIDNLITNAIKFTTKGKIEFGFIKQADKLRFYVKDTGKGISRKRQKSVFNRFNQDIEDKVKGTGLGLAISKQLAQLMGSDLCIESTLNKGSEFYFLLAFDENIKSKAIIVKENIEIKDWSSKTILIAEDEENNYELLKEMLLETKAKIIWVNNGADAVDYCLKNNPDLVLMDIKMPIMDGFTATSKIIEKKPETKIIAQTAYAMVGEKEKAISIGCSDFVTKPLNRDTLFYKMNKLI